MWSPRPVLLALAAALVVPLVASGPAPAAYAADANLEGKANFGFVSKYQKGATTPTVRFALTIQTSDALPEVLVTIDGQTQTFARTMPAAKTFTWDGARARTVRIAPSTSRARGTTSCTVGRFVTRSTRSTARCSFRSARISRPTPATRSIRSRKGLRSAMVSSRGRTQAPAPGERY